MKILDGFIWAMGRIWGTSLSLRLLLYVHEYRWCPFVKKNTPPYILYALDSEYYSCGFADRLRGMISAYALSKIYGVGFKIKHKEPFLLSNYLSPNKVDWIFDENSAEKNLANIRLYTSLNKDSRFPKYKHPLIMQLHYYSNRDILTEINHYYNANYCFSELYNELFLPSFQLKSAVKDCIDILGDNYVSVSFRFVNLLGDFPEGGQIPLDQTKQMLVIEKCARIVEIVKERNTGVSKVLVTADSIAFLKHVSTIPYVYVIPGKPAHSGHKDNIDNDSNMKTFADFLLISRAKKSYLGIVGSMYNSNFARTAAYSQGHGFEIIQL